MIAHPSRTSTRCGAWLLLALLLVGLSAACTRDPAREKQRLLEQGLAYHAQGKYNEAVIQLRNALAIDPKFAPALVALGRAYAAKHWHFDAIRELQRAVDLQGDAIQTRIDLARSLIVLELWSDVQTQARAVRATDPDNAYGFFLAGAAATARGEATEALQLLERAVSRAPAVPEIRTAHADALAAAGRIAEAEAGYRAALGQHPDDVQALLGLGTLRMRQGDNRAAGEALAKARAREPDNPMVRIALSNLRLAEGKPQEALGELETLPRPSQSLRVVLNRGQLYVKAGRYSDALSLMNEVTQRFPQLAPARYLRAHAAHGAGKPEQAITDFQAVVTLTDGNPLVRFALGVAYVNAGRPAEALKELDAIATALAKLPEYHVQVGRAWQAMGRPGDALRAGEAALRLAPASPAVHTFLAGVHLSRNEPDKARELYARAAELDPRFAPGHLGLGRVYDLQKKPEEALREYDAALAAAPGHPEAVAAKVATLLSSGRAVEASRFLQAVMKERRPTAHLHSLLGTVFLSQRDLRRATEEYENAVKLDQGYVPARLRLAGLALAGKRPADAVHHLQLVVKDHPGNLPAALLLADLQARRAQFDRAIPVLEAAAQANPQALDVSLRLAEMYATAGRLDEAAARVSPVVTTAPKLVPARLLLGLVLLSKGNPDEALKHFREVEKLDPRNARARYYSGRALVAKGDVEGGRRAFEAALAIEPGLMEVRVELAALSRQKPDEKQLADHTREARRALAADPDNPMLRYTLAQALLAQKQVKEAEAELTNILAKAPTFVPANLAMGVLRMSEGRADLAVAHLDAVVRADPNQLQARLLLGAYHEARQDRGPAIEHLTAALRLAPQRDDVRLRLAALYGQTGREEDGVKLARAVVQAQPKLASAHYVLGSLELKRGQLTPATEALASAVRLDPTLVGAHVSLGSAYERKGDTEQAVAAYRKAAALAPKDPLPPNNAAWALAVRGRSLDEALALATTAQRLATGNPAHAASLPRILDTLGFVRYQRGEYAEAEDVLRRAAEAAPRDATIHYHLALTYHRLGRKVEAASWLRRALQAEPGFESAEAARKLLQELSAG